MPAGDARQHTAGSTRNPAGLPDSTRRAARQSGRDCRPPGNAAYGADMRKLVSNREHPAMDAAKFRSARADEASLLGELALRSKGYWGYDEDFLEACRPELTFRPADVAARRIVVAEGATGVFGFYSIDGEPPSGELGNMWVVPEQIGT